MGHDRTTERPGVPSGLQHGADFADIVNAVAQEDDRLSLRPLLGDGFPQSGGQIGRGARRLRAGDGANPAVYAGLYSAEQQRRAYPDVEPIILEVTPQRAYEIALQVVNRRKWLIIDERAPQLPLRIGRIEAVARTPVMGFREDVSIRVGPDTEGARVDVRSSSRYFEHDLGSNAARIIKLSEDLNEVVDNARPAKKSLVPVKPQPKGTPKR